MAHNEPITRSAKPRSAQRAQFLLVFIAASLSSRSPVIKSKGKHSEHTCLPFWLGSVGSNTFLIGTATASPGIRGLSTYLGFLMGPEMWKDLKLAFFPHRTQITEDQNNSKSRNARCRQRQYTHNTCYNKDSELSYFHSRCLLSGGKSSNSKL